MITILFNSSIRYFNAIESKVLFIDNKTVKIFKPFIIALKYLMEELNNMVIIFDLK
jgi:hypothetical protein